jgi:hypothetical protein
MKYNYYLASVAIKRANVTSLIIIIFITLLLGVKEKNF